MLTKIFLFSFAAIAVFVGTSFFSWPAWADSQCCVTSLGNVVNSCRLQTGGPPCNALGIQKGDKNRCQDYAHQSSAKEEKEGSVSLDSSVEHEVMAECMANGLKIPERQVVCKAEALCKQKLLQLTKCNTFDDDRDLCLANANCFYFAQQCLNRDDAGICTRITDPTFCGVQKGGSNKGSVVCAWEEKTNRCLSVVEKQLSDRYGDGSNSLLISCAAKGNCRSIDDFLKQLFKIATWSFGLIGTISFMFFVYGGFVIILSFGNPERVQHGKQVITAAVVGILIVFGGYILVQFLVGALGVTGDFRILI